MRGGRGNAFSHRPGSREYFVPRFVFSFHQPGRRDRGSSPDAGRPSRIGVERKIRRQPGDSAMENGLHLLVHVMRSPRRLRLRPPPRRLHPGERLGFLPWRISAAGRIFSTNTAPISNLIFRLPVRLPGRILPSRILPGRILPSRILPSRIYGLACCHGSLPSE